MKLNNDSKPILTVAIPTHNRIQTLNKVLDQLSREKNQAFTIQVCDNASSDGTEGVVRNLQKKMNNLRYHRNEKNLGPWGNTFNLYKFSKTKYIWFLSDDEEIIPGAIGKILLALNKYQPAVALFNHIKIDPYGRRLVDGVPSDTFYDDINKLKDYGKLLRAGFLSIIILEKRISPNTIKEKYIKDNYFFQMTLVLLVLGDRFKFCEIATPIVFRNTGYVSGEFFKFIITDLLESVFIINPKFDNKKFIENAKKQIFKALMLYLSQKLGLFMFHGKLSKITVKRIFKYYGLTSLFILSFPIIGYLIPGFMLKFVYKFQLQRIHGKKRGIMIYRQNLDRSLRFNRNSGHIS